MNEGLQVKNLSAHYRDNEPSGVGVMIEFVGPNDGVDFCRHIESCMPKYDRLTVAEVRSELERLSPKRYRLTQDEAAHVIACVHWLERNRHLVPDENNGMMFHCAYKDALIFCEYNPVTIDLDVKLASGNSVDITDIARASRGVLDTGVCDAIRVVTDHARARAR